MSETYNAVIKSVSLGYDDHGILTFALKLDMDGYGCIFGGFELDEYVKELDRRVPTAKGLEILTKIMSAVGVTRWEDLEGKYCRVRESGNGIIKAIGNILKNDWCNIEKFYEPIVTADDDV